MRSLLALAMTAPLIAAAGTPAPAQTAAPAAPAAYPQTSRSRRWTTTTAPRSPTRTAGSRTTTPPRPRPGSRREQGHLRLPGQDPAARRDPQAPDRALELRALRRCPRKRGGRYFFTRNDGLQNQAVSTRRSARRRAAGAARSEHAVGGRHRRAVGGTTFSRRRQAAGLRLADGRLRLERVEGARRRDRQGPGRRPASGSKFSRRRVDARRQGLLLQPLRRARRRARR